MFWSFNPVITHSSLVASQSESLRLTTTGAMLLFSLPASLIHTPMENNGVGRVPAAVRLFGGLCWLKEGVGGAVSCR